MKNKIVCQWVEEKERVDGRAMRVVESDHARFVVGSRFDWGFATVAGCQGYALEILPVPVELVTPLKAEIFEVDMASRKPAPQTMKLRCRLLFHRWMAWSQQVTDKNGVPWQARQCYDCGIRENRPCY